jgi:hypothetical protein
MNEPILFEVYLDILWHSLGMSSRNRRRALAWWLDNDNHRNHFCHTVGNTKYEELLEKMVCRGWMVQGQIINDGRDRYYHATEDGIKVARENFPRPCREK